MSISQEEALALVKSMKMPMLIDGEEIDRLKQQRADLLFALKRIVQDLPKKRDWLDPAIERHAREAIKAAEEEG